MKFTVNLILLAAAFPALAGENETNFQVDVRMVQLRATVTDSLGQHVRNLSKDDFEVFENGVRQNIRMVVTPEQKEAAPTTVFVLFDTSNRMYDDFPYAEDCVADFVRELSPSDAVAVYSFTRNLARLAPASRDRLLTLSGLREAVVGDATALYDALLLTLRNADRVVGSKVIVVFSNGADNASMLSSDDVRRLAEDEGVPIYVLSTKTSSKQENEIFNELTSSTAAKRISRRTGNARSWHSKPSATI